MISSHVKILPVLNGMPNELYPALLDKLSLSDILNLRSLNKELSEVINEYLINELKVIQIACGLFHNVILLKNGRVLVMGNNSQGQLGLGQDVKKVALPRELEHIGKIKQIEANYSQTYLLTADGSVLVMGSNTMGQLGFDASIKNIFNPKPIPGICNAQFITAQDNTTAIFTYPNQIRCFGKVDSLTPLYIDHKIKLFHNGLDLPKQVAIKDISIGKDHILLLSHENEVYGFGQNLNGNLGLKGQDYIHTWTKVFSDLKAIKIKATDLGSLILTSQNRLIVAGLDHGQFGIKEVDNVGFDIDQLVIDTPQEVNTQGEIIMDIAANNFSTLLLTDKNELLSLQKPAKSDPSNKAKNSTSIAGFFQLKNHLSQNFELTNEKSQQQRIL